jgi:hypothetical protein
VDIISVRDFVKKCHVDVMRILQMALFPEGHTGTHGNGMPEGAPNGKPNGMHAIPSYPGARESNSGAKGNDPPPVWAMALLY